MKYTHLQHGARRGRYLHMLSKYPGVRMKVWVQVPRSRDVESDLSNCINSAAFPAALRRTAVRTMTWERVKCTLLVPPGPTRQELGSENSSELIPEPQETPSVHRLRVPRGGGGGGVPRGGGGGGPWWWWGGGGEQGEAGGTVPGCRPAPTVPPSSRTLEEPDHCREEAI